MESFSAGLEDITDENKEQIHSVLVALGDVADSMKDTLGKNGQVTMAAEHLNKSMESLDKILSKVERGEGTVGKLLNDDTTVNKMNDTLDKFKHFAAKLVNELSSNYSENKIDLIVRLNRKLSGWANFYQFTDYTAVMFGKLDQIMFWKIGYWLARKFRTSIKSLMKQWFRRPDKSKARTWALYGRNGKGNLGGVVLKRLVTSRKSQFRWRNPETNPYILRDESRNTVTSRYNDVAMAMSHA